MRYKLTLALTITTLALLGAACSKTAAPSTKTPNNTYQTSNTNTSAPAPLTTPEPKLESMAVVNITANGFTPNVLTIKQGRTVNFVNQDSAIHWPASDPHPTHTLYPGFDALKGLGKGDTYAFTFTKIGTWTYHDHLHPSTKGTIIVTQ